MACHAFYESCELNQARARICTKVKGVQSGQRKTREGRRKASAVVLPVEVSDEEKVSRTVRTDKNGGEGGIEGAMKEHVNLENTMEAQEGKRCDWCRC